MDGSAPRSGIGILPHGGDRWPHRSSRLADRGRRPGPAGAMAAAGTRAVASGGRGAEVAGRLVLLPASPSQSGTNRGASGQWAVTLLRALGWLWGRMGVALVGLWGGFRVALYSGVYAEYMPSIWLCGGFGWLY